MNFLPRRYEKDQSNLFGKRGLQWHITMTFHGKDIESLGVVHIFQSQVSQDSIHVTTAVIIIDAMETFSQLTHQYILFPYLLRQY